MRRHGRVHTMKMQPQYYYYEDWAPYMSRAEIDLMTPERLAEVVQVRLCRMPGPLELP